tara:strand:+ start:446 stop:880 length:435 start_codon:yes stop_codon:yes gene_type:complete
MTRTERLQPVVQHADKKQQQALLEVARCQRALEMEEKRLAQLKNYKHEYLSKKHEEQPVYSAVELQEFHRFIEQLDQTIEKQLELVKLRQFEFDAKRNSWQETRVGSKVIHKVVENLQLQEVVAEAREEQKTLDEFSQRCKPRS